MARGKSMNQGIEARKNSVHVENYQMSALAEEKKSSSKFSMSRSWEAYTFNTL